MRNILLKTLIALLISLKRKKLLVEQSEARKEKARAKTERKAAKAVTKKEESKAAAMKTDA